MGEGKSGPRWICLGDRQDLKSQARDFEHNLEGNREPVKGSEWKSNGVALAFKENHSSAGGVGAKEME